MTRPHVGLSLMLDDDFRTAVLPLLESGAVDVLEWSFDTCWDVDTRAPGVAALLDAYAAEGRLLGHGVTFSPLSAGGAARQRDWLARLTGETARRRYTHVSEHFGFLSADGFDDGAPLPMPCCAASLRVGRDRIARLADAAGVPVGLENLAFAFGRDDIEGQGAFLDALLAPTDGFLVLDLHNLYCQAANFDVAPDLLLEAYPLHRVRELHVSGGSWSQASDGTRVRRDTHDEAVPREVFALLGLALRSCPQVSAVIFERLGGTIRDAAAASQLRADYARVRSVVDSRTYGARTKSTLLGEREALAPRAHPIGCFLSWHRTSAAFQAALLALLAEGLSPDETMARLASDPAFAAHRAWTASFEPRMVEVASALVRKWARGRLRQTRPAD